MYKNLGKVKGFEKYSNYLVSDDGRIINCKNGKELSGHRKNSNDYERVTLYDCEGKAKTFTVHYIIASCYIPNPEGKPEIDHINDNKRDNSVENLRWCDRKENMAKSNRNFKKIKTTVLDLKTLEIWNFNSIAEASFYLEVPYDSLYRIRLTGNQLLDGYHVIFN